jgi:hypothetical protein
MLRQKRRDRAGSVKLHHSKLLVTMDSRNVQLSLESPRDLSGTCVCEHNKIAEF